MSAATKALLIIVAIAACVAGVLINSARVSDQIDTQALLSATLLDNREQPITQAISERLEKLTLINFWASWCTPCREEMPIFETMVRANQTRGFQVIGVAIDTPDKAQAMLDSMDITYPIFYAERVGMQLMDSAGNPQGLLPYSLLVNQHGEVLQQVLGKIHEQDIAYWLEQYLE